MGILLAIIASFNIGLSALFMKRSFKDFTPAVSLGYFTFFVVVLWSIVGLGFGVTIEDLPKAFLYGLIGATFAQGVYIFVLSKGELSITGTILASYPIYTVISSILLLGEKLTAEQAIFVALNILGTIVVSIPHKLGKGDLSNYKYIIWPVVGSISVGLSDTVSKNAIDSIDLGTYLLALAWAHIPVTIVALLLSKEYKDFKFSFGQYKFAIIGSLILSVGTLFLYMSFNYGKASIVAPITATYPGLIILLSVFFLGERLSLKDLMGLIMVLTGIIGVSLV
ncbi:EamA family transporter [Candidatus Dojkabacteria bacterium]|nr:EamA family transporter [Candidatus Dojkabacteria bacterium]